MKNSILTSAIILCLSLFAVKSQANTFNKGKYDSLSCLQIEGKVLNADEGEDGTCIVELITLNNGIDSICLKEGRKKFKFILEKNSYYAIRVSKKGYISKLVSVNTEILTEVEGIHRFVFETTLIKEAALKRLNKDAVDFPVAIIHFDYEMDGFSYNKEYTNSMKRELHQIPSNNPTKGLASVNR